MEQVGEHAYRADHELSLRDNIDCVDNIKGVYPHSDGSLSIVDIDALKGFVDLWVHFFVAIEDIHRN